MADRGAPDKTLRQVFEECQDAFRGVHMDLSPCPDCGAAPKELRCECDYAGIRVQRRIAELEAEVAKMKRNCWRKPTHGPCCTCQRCGKDYDSCRCDLADAVDECEAAEARVKELEAEVERLRADAEHELMMAFVDGAKWWEWKTTKFTMWQSDQNEAAEAWKEKRARTQRDAARKAGE